MEPKIEALTPTTPKRALATSPESLEVNTAKAIIAMESNEDPSMLANATHDASDTYWNAPSRMLPVQLAPTASYTQAYRQDFIPFPASFSQLYEPSIGLGRLLPPFDEPGRWECIFAHAGPPRFCGAEFDTDADVLRHFCEEHHPIQRNRIEAYFVCRLCQMWNSEMNYCLQCGRVEPDSMEWWLSGYPVADRIENLSAGETLLPPLWSLGSMTQGRCEKLEDGFEAEEEQMVTGAIEAVHQGQYGYAGREQHPSLFTAPNPEQAEEAHRRLAAAEADAFEGQSQRGLLPTPWRDESAQVLDVMSSTPHHHHPSPSM